MTSRKSDLPCSVDRAMALYPGSLRDSKMMLWVCMYRSRGATSVKLEGRDAKHA